MAHFNLYRADDYSRMGLERIYEYFDRLHDIACEGHLREFTNMNAAELIEYFHEVCFVLEETIREIEAHEANVRAAMRNQDILE